MEEGELGEWISLGGNERQPSRATRYRHPRTASSPESRENDAGLRNLDAHCDTTNSTSPSSLHLQNYINHLPEQEPGMPLTLPSRDDRMYPPLQSQDEMFNEPWDRDAHEQLLSSSESENELQYDRNGTDSLCEDIDDDMSYGFKTLKSFISKEENNVHLESSPAGDRSELLLAVLKYSLANNLSQTAVADLFKLISTFFGIEFLPTTRYLVDKLFNNEEGVIYHACCPSCKKYVSKFERRTRSVTCQHCNFVINLRLPTYNDFFVVIDVRHEIANLLETYWEDYQNNIKKIGDGNNFSDFTDGLQYLAFLRSLPPDVRLKFITAIFNTDGVPVTNSSGLSIWAWQFIINELRYEIRMANPLTCMMWFGHDKPDMQILEKQFVLYMNELADEGITVTVGGEKHDIKLFNLCSAVDTIARAAMQALIQLGHFGCSWCLHPGIYVKSPPNRDGESKGGAVKFVVIEDVENRSEEETLEHMERSLTSEEPVMGFKYPPWLLNLKRFKFIKGFVPDPMHQLSGIAKQFLQKWLSWFTPAEREAADLLMKTITVPSQVQRLSRSLKEWKRWKSIEYENWLLYYSLPILRTIPRLSHIADHWALLVEGVYKLNKMTVTRLDIVSAHELFKEFVVKTEELYGKYFMTYNVHQLLHLAQSVLDWGPLWSHNCYCFESNNQNYLKQIHSAKGVIYQVCRAVSMKQSELILRRHVASKPESVVVDFVQYLDYRRVQSTCKMMSERYFSWYRKPSEDYVARLGLTEYARIYDKMVKGGCLYNTKRNKPARSDNSYARTSDASYVQILEFVVDEFLQKSVMICNVMDVRQSFRNRDLPMMEIIGISGRNVVISTEKIETICVAVRTNDVTYLIAPPNLYHK